MATYKVIQDIEAEDKFVGPLTLKQFVFAMAGVGFGYLTFVTSVQITWWVGIVFLPLSLFGFFMAIPWSKDQPTDVWVLAKLRFKFKPKVRIWDQAGIQDLVTITAPKAPEKILVNNLSEKDVKSRLKALAETIDSRGWAVKNSTIEQALTNYNALSDRLVSASTLPQYVPIENLDSIPDMMDNTAMMSMVSERDDLIKSQALEKMQRIRSGEPLETINQPQVVITPPSERYSTIATQPINEDVLTQQLKEKRKAGDIAYQNMSNVPVFPVSSAPQAQLQYRIKQKSHKTDDDHQKKTEVEKAQASVTEQTDPDILNLARNNDLNVATIARQAKNDQADNNEVVISLH